MHQLTTTALLAVLILLSGMLRLPSPFPGGEFQLSAPIAVLICACCGIRRYIAAGIIASLLGLLLGTATILNVIIAMVFRLTVGVIIYAFGSGRSISTVSGPLGTMAARFVLALLVDIDFKVLLLAAAPGMLFTGISVFMLYKPVLHLLKTATPGILKEE